MKIEPNLELSDENIEHNPDDDFFRKFLEPYYVLTADNQYLFASTQKGRRPDRAFFMVPEGYKLGKKQNSFDAEIGKKLFKTIKDYLKTCKVLVQEGIQGEAGYETGMRVTTSVQNPYAAYMAWMMKMMVFPPKDGMDVSCFNYVVQEPLPEEWVSKIKEFYPEFDTDEPLTLYDFTEMEKGVRRVMSLRVDYFGGAYKKPNLTMVWNNAESEGLISYHAGCTYDRVLKGLSGTGKTTLTVGPELEQDDALLGKPIEEGGKIDKVQLIGLEAASFAKSQGLEEGSPEWPGLMKSKEALPDGSRPVILAMNIDCEGVEYVMNEIGGYEVQIPQARKGQKVGHLVCTKYDDSDTTNGRFVFLFSELNKNWGKSEKPKYMKTESLSFKRFDILEPIFRVTDPVMAAALDSACETIITSAISGQKTGTRVRSYAATDFIAREQSQQALLKWKMYTDMDLSPDGKLVFFINNAGKVGASTLEGDDTEGGEKVKVQDSKKLVDLLEHRKIESWIKHPCFGYLIPDPKEPEEKHGMKDFRKRFTLLRFYTPAEIIEFYKRDIRERTDFLSGLFSGQEGEKELEPVINVWKSCEIPKPEEVKEFYETNYGTI